MEAQEENEKEENEWLGLYDFGVHILIACGIFILIALAAVGIHIFLHFLEANEAPAFVITVLSWIEYLIFGVDVILFVLHIIRKFIKTIKLSWRQGF